MKKNTVFHVLALWLIATAVQADRDTDIFVDGAIKYADEPVSKWEFFLFDLENRNIPERMSRLEAMYEESDFSYYVDTFGGVEINIARIIHADNRMEEDDSRNNLCREIIISAKEAIGVSHENGGYAYGLDNSLISGSLITPRSIKTKADVKFIQKFKKVLDRKTAVKVVVLDMDPVDENNRSITCESKLMSSEVTF